MAFYVMNVFYVQAFWEYISQGVFVYLKTYIVSLLCPPRTHNASHKYKSVYKIIMFPFNSAYCC